MSRPSKVAAPGSAGRASSSTAATAPPPRSAAGTSSPLSGPTKYRCPPPFASTRRATPRRADPTPGSTTPSTTPSPRCGRARTRALAPAATSKGGTSWVRSMTTAAGASRRSTAANDTRELVAGPVVGEEEDGVGGRHPAGFSPP